MSVVARYHVPSETGEMKETPEYRALGTMVDTDDRSVL
jgi:hypothetical protein